MGPEIGDCPGPPVGLRRPWPQVPQELNSHHGIVNQLFLEMLTLDLSGVQYEYFIQLDISKQHQWRVQCLLKHAALGQSICNLSLLAIYTKMLLTITFLSILCTIFLVLILLHG